jgi:hypothetical protein
MSKIYTNLSKETKLTRIGRFYFNEEVNCLNDKENYNFNDIKKIARSIDKDGYRPKSQATRGPPFDRIPVLGKIISLG